VRTRWNGPLGMREVSPYASRVFVRLWGRSQVRRAHPSRLSTLSGEGSATGRSSGVSHHGDGRVEDAFDVSGVRGRE
jgi:hypothetical protein